MKKTEKFKPTTTKEKLIDKIANLANEIIVNSNDLLFDKTEEIVVIKEVVNLENAIDIWSEYGTIKILKVGNEIYYLIPTNVSGYDLDAIKQKYWCEINEAINILSNGK